MSKEPLFDDEPSSVPQASADGAEEQVLISRPINIVTIAKKGLRTKISLSEEERERVCLFHDLQEIAHFEAKVFLEKKTTTHFHLKGHLSAQVAQTCVLSLQAVTTLIEEEIDLTLIPASEFEQHMERTDEEGMLVVGLDRDVPDVYDHDVIDLGPFVLEHFALGLDPYPKAENAELDQTFEGNDRVVSPFAGLAALKAKMKPSE